MLLQINLLFFIIPLAVVLLIVTFYLIFKKDIKKTKSVVLDKMYLSLNSKYMFRKEIEFFYFLNKILPKEYIAFSKVGVDNLVMPSGSKIGYNSLFSKYLDFVIFKEDSMTPVLVIDIYDNTFGDEILSQQEPIVVKALTEVNLPFISILVKSNFNEEEAKNLILEKLNNKKAD